MNFFFFFLSRCQWFHVATDVDNYDSLHWIFYNTESSSGANETPCYLTGFIVVTKPYMHWTKTKISLCCAYQNMSFPTHVCQRIGQNFCKVNEMCRNFALSYTFPIIMKSIFSSSGPVNLILDGKALEMVNAYKYLGVWITSNLSWTKQIEENCKKANQK